MRISDLSSDVCSSDLLDAAHPHHLHHATLRAPSRSPGLGHVRCPVMTITIAGEALVAYLLASVRIVAWLAVVPPFSSRAIPAMAKVVLSLGLAFAMAPALAQDTIEMGTRSEEHTYELQSLMRIS